jgi:LysR family transcriptional regulator, glycine cleavage system transcriptional activator
MRNLNRIPLSGLRAIESIGRRGSLTAAAEELGVTPGALSQRLQKAEAAFGRPLFARLPSGLFPTPACAEALPGLTRAMGDLARAVEMLDAVENPCLTISTAPIFASRWLVWRIRGFNAEAPEVRVRIEPGTALLDPGVDDVDICLRVGKGPWPGTEAVKLLDQKVFPVCAPDLARSIATSEDLVQLPVIRETDALFGWEAWLAPHGLAVRDLADGPTYGDASLCLDAAMTGQGVFMAWETLACDALAMGQLVAPLPGRRATGNSYWFVTSPAGARLAKVRRFRTWIEEELARSVAAWRDEARRDA